MLHRYFVTYIEREGNFAKKAVYAKDKGDAKRIASEQGCDDIKKVARADAIPASIFVCVIFVIAVIVLFVLAFSH